MSDITAQEFREAAAWFVRHAEAERRHKDDLGQSTAALFQRNADLFLAAAEQREALDRATTHLANIEGLRDGEAHLFAIDALAKQVATLTAERDQLRSALTGLVGAETREELEQMEVVMRMMSAPAEDKAASIDAIHALLKTDVA